MLMIRLQRVGRRNHAEFRVVVTEHARAAKSANYIEMVGHYNPHTDAFTVKEDRVQHWISNGAQVSDTLHNLLVENGVLKGEKKNVLPKKTPIVKEEPEEKEKATEEEEKATEETEEVKEESEAAEDAEEKAEK
jgi:small subunit ribosomal protein S16